jgi:putative ABC transport system permease protein
MNLKECFLVAMEGIRVNKMRSALTMLGIIIGVAAVITVVAIGQIGQSAIMTSLEKIGTNLFAVYPINNEQSATTLADMVTVQDLVIIKNVATDIKYISPVNDRTLPVKYGRESKRANVYGVWPEYQHIRNVKVEKGRYLSEADEKAARRVIVIDSKLAKDFFGREDALTKQIDVFGMPMTIIGISERNDDFLTGGPNQPSTIYMPFATFNGINGWGFASYIEASAVSKEKTDNAMKQAKQILEYRHHTKDKYQAYSMKQDMEQINNIMGILQLVIGSIAAISLLVGGIGVMNIMLVSVTERTREIGIKKAIGAKRSAGDFVTNASPRRSPASAGRPRVAATMLHIAKVTA